MRNWAKKRCLQALVLVLCLLPSAAAATSRTTATPTAAQATAKASVAPIAAVSARKAPAKPVSTAVKPLWSEIFVRADLQPDGRYRFIGGLTRDLAGAGLRLSVAPADKSGFLAPSEWRWVDQTYDDMQPIAGYPSVHKTRPLYMRADEPLDVDLLPVAQEVNGNAILPDAYMRVEPCRPGTCPQHLQVDLQVYYGPDGVQETLTTQIAAPHGAKLRNGFITYPGNPFFGNNQPQRPFPAYESNGPTRQVSQIVVPYDLGLRGVDTYSAEATTATREDFIPADALAYATTDLYAGF